ncbi:MAG: hypothetical protein KME15_07945 [Drouetiella hepatica Uher 2000/2452]|jgi:tetratricopeptide (TPR) repeat protein|uniref:Tetratricopeptide repeat protein n=1 Tax=Drouetiella hepatica Uher 2000/2452 TaxID=904376 RepID=A0A951QB47_9CYAN|nr:hypothetical protein [Drouetiella hepatica Uher 2000/2452]
MKCPVCRALYRPASATAEAAQSCRRCGVNLSPLIQLHDRAVWHHRQAIQAFRAGDYATAIASNNQAIALWSNADFHAFAGQLWALQGEFPQAIAAWKAAQQIDSQQAIAHTALQYLTE